MVATASPPAPIERTEHPDVVKSADVLGGEPTVDGTRLAVRHILRRYRDLGESPETIADHFGLTLAQVLDALSYCYDHPEEIASHEERHKIRNVMRKHGLLMVGTRLIRPAVLETISLAPEEPMAATTTTRTPIERTEHPYVVKSAGTLGGEARIDGTRISVVQIFDMADAGMSAAEIVATFPDLSLAQVHDALSYAHDHLDDLADYREQHKLRSVLKANNLVYYSHRLLTAEQLNALKPLPPGAEVYTWETLPPDLDE
jgi:uncharacterized protein (DUF433 family)